MKKIIKIISSVSRKVLKTDIKPFDRISNPDEISKLIIGHLNSEEPCMIARYGATELFCLANYKGVKKGKPNIIRYLLGLEQDWWWNPQCLSQIEQWSGFFPATPENMMKFGKLMEDSSKEVDILASWLNNEPLFKDELHNAIKVMFLFIDPFWSKTPWTSALKGKKVLVIHPFANQIEMQYKNSRTKLFKNPDVLPLFELHTIKAVQSLGGDDNGFKDWFEALAWMESEMDKIDYDIALIGCGAYGFPLAAHAKKSGKKAVHIGGSLQLLFGIIGRRWENPDYGIEELGIKGCYPALVNEFWIRPGEEGKAKNSDKVENACYW